MPRRRRSSSKQLTTTIEMAVDEDDVDPTTSTADGEEDAGKGDAKQTLIEPEWKRNARGLVYFDDYDGVLDDDTEAVPIEVPDCSIDSETSSIYQCIKCGRKMVGSQAGDSLFRFKCTRCFGKAFSKIRPTKWVKFNAI